MDKKKKPTDAVVVFDPDKDIQLPPVTEGRWKNYKLHFQKCTYVYPKHPPDEGFRFVWYNADNKIQAYKGQARIPSANDLRQLLVLAEKAGWFPKA